MESTYPSPQTSVIEDSRPRRASHARHNEPIDPIDHELEVKARAMVFHPITPQDMPVVWNYLRGERGRTTDFSYGGVLMWIDMFHYEYCVVDDTLFIKGKVEDDLSKDAFSMPVGSLPLSASVRLLKCYCQLHGMRLEFSAVPEYALSDFAALSPLSVENLENWGDYLYEAQSLATLTGKKMSKKRNHVNKFVSENPDWTLEPLDAGSVGEVLGFMEATDGESSQAFGAQEERQLTRKVLEEIRNGNEVLTGALLRAGGKICAFTIADMKGDTLFIHVEKATRQVAGSYEAINHLFAKHIMECHPEIDYINREDDAGDMGLRIAKESYHPVTILKKYNILF